MTETNARRDPLSACEHGTPPQTFCADCEQTKAAYAAQVAKVREIRARVLGQVATELDEPSIEDEREAAHAEALLCAEELETNAQRDQQTHADLERNRVQIQSSNTEDDKGVVSIVHEATKDGKTNWAAVAEALTARSGRDYTTAQTSKPSVDIHTAGELHGLVQVQADITINLSRLLSDPARTLPERLRDLDGTDARIEDFVFATDGAQDLYWDIVKMIEVQLKRGKDVTVLILCRGGKHRSVSFGNNLASLFQTVATHHHKHLDRVVKQA